MDVLFTNIANHPLYTTLTPYLQTAYPHLQNTLPLLHSTYQTLHALSTQSLQIVLPILQPLLNLASQEAQRFPGIVALAFMVAILWATFYIMGLVRRLVAFGVRVAVEVVFWGVLGLGVWVVLERGVGRTGAEFWAWAVRVGERFGEEYERAVRERERAERGW